MKRIKQRLTVKTDYFRVVTVFMAILGAALVAVLMAGGTASAEEKENGLIYYNYYGIRSLDPATGFKQLGTSIAKARSFYFDISPDRRDLLYAECCYEFLSLYTFPMSGGDAVFDESEVPIANKSDSIKLVQNPRFSPDGKTIYFVGVHVVDPPEGVNDPTYDTGAIYSVPTEGGEATKIPINLANDDGTLRGIYYFALSNDGSKFALEGDHGVFTVPVGGGDATRVSNDSCNGTGNSKWVDDPKFSPDDQTIVYTSNIWGGANCSGTSRRTIYTTPANNDGTSAGTALFPKDATDAYPSDAHYKWHPSYSPDSKSIVFDERQNGDRSYYLSTAPATGGDTTTKITYSSYSYPLWIEKNPPPSPLPQTRIEYEDWQYDYMDLFPYTFSFSSPGDEEAKFECRLDFGTWDTCTSPQDYYDDNLSEGQHTFQVRAINSAGTDPTPANYIGTVDTIAPDTSIEKGPDEGSTLDTDSATFEFSANESATFECRLDSTAWADWESCSSPKTYTGLSNGSHTFEVRAGDKAYNYDDSPASRTWTVDKPDTTAPSAPVISSPTEGSYDNDGDFTVSGSAETDSTVKLYDEANNEVGTDKAEGGTWSVSLSGVSEGPHTYTANATDAADNTSPNSAGLTVTVDKTAPSEVTGLSATPGDAKVDLSWTNPTASDLDKVRVLRSTSAAATSPEPGSGQTQVYEGTATSYSDTGLTNSTKYYYTVFARDMAGNWSSAASTSATTTSPPPPDTTRPTVDETSLNPSKLQTGVRRNTDIKATFSEEMKRTTLTPSTVKLSVYNKRKGRYVPVTDTAVSCDSACKTVTLDPYGTSSTLLGANKKYKVTITTAVKDKVGNALAQNYVWTFKTGSS